MGLALEDVKFVGFFNHIVNKVTLNRTGLACNLSLTAGNLIDNL